MVEGITCAPAVTGRVLPDARASLTWGITGECDDVNGIEHAGCVRGAGQAMAFLLSLEGDLTSAIRTRRASLVRARPQFLYTVPDQPGTRSNMRAVGCSFLRVVHDAGELTGAPAASVPVVPHGSHRLWVPEPLRSGWGHHKQLAGTA